MPDENLLGPERPERADAAANRRRILVAAERLFTEQGPNITMTDLARAADVGRGTLYRRYPDVAAVAVALLDAHERDLQEQILSGPPPLGPGGTPRERLKAFYRAMVELLERHLPLALGAEQGAARFRVGAYGFWRSFVASLLRQSAIDSDPLVDALLAPLAPEVYQYQRHEQGQTVGDIKKALDRLTCLLPDCLPPTR